MNNETILLISFLVTACILGLISRFYNGTMNQSLLIHLALLFALFIDVLISELVALQMLFLGIFIITVLSLVYRFLIPEIEEAHKQDFYEPRKKSAWAVKGGDE